MSEEGDIGLFNLSRQSDLLQSAPSSPSKRKHMRRISTVSILRTEEKTAIKSPSNPDLLNSSPKASPRKLSRSNTLPRLSRTESTASGSKGDDLSNLSMEAGKVVRLRRWILALVIVDFDLDYGPKITSTYPTLDLSPSEQENIAFSAFPDSPQAESGSYIHSFRVRHLVAAGDTQITTEDGFIYGFSHFTQRRDSTSKRGYQQRSLVILTQHPYPSLFYTVLSYLGQAFLSHGGPMLEVACHNIANWPDPMPASILELGFLGYVFTADLPRDSDTQQSTSMNRSSEKYDPDSHILATLAPHHPPIIKAFESCLSHLWSIWECLVLCEPIILFGPSAVMTSQAVWWLRDLLRPIPLAGDFRPFFTIHDVDHAALVNTRAPAPGLLVGVTNPFFERACSHWPHTLSLGSTKKRKTITVDLTVGPAPGWKTKSHKRHISRDQILLKKLEDACQGGEAAQMKVSEELRQHFVSRTTAFLVPLQRYLNTLIPTHADRSAAPSPVLPSSTTSSLTLPSSSTLTIPGSAALFPKMKPFNENSFFVSLKLNGSPLPFKSTAKRKDFYERFLRTRAFGMWLAAQEEVVNRVLAEPPQSATPISRGSRSRSPA